MAKLKRYQLSFTPLILSSEVSNPLSDDLLRLQGFESFMLVNNRQNILSARSKESVVSRPVPFHPIVTQRSRSNKVPLPLCNYFHQWKCTQTKFEFLEPRLPDN